MADVAGITIGSLLIEVGRQKVKIVGAEKAKDLIKTMARPLKLLFEVTQASMEEATEKEHITPVEVVQEDELPIPEVDVEAVRRKLQEQWKAAVVKPPPPALSASGQIAPQSMDDLLAADVLKKQAAKQDIAEKSNGHAKSVNKAAEPTALKRPPPVQKQQIKVNSSALSAVHKAKNGSLARGANADLQQDGGSPATNLSKHASLAQRADEARTRVRGISRTASTHGLRSSNAVDRGSALRESRAASNITARA